MAKLQVILVVDDIPSLPITAQLTKAAKEAGRDDAYYASITHAGWGGGINITPKSSVGAVQTLQAKVAELEKLLAAKK